MNEQWHIWKPLDKLFRKYDIDVLKLDGNRLTITMDPCPFAKDLAGLSAIASVRCVFSWIGAMRMADDLLRYNLLGELKSAYGDSFYGDNTFFTVENSRYLAWVAQESCDFSKSVPYVHYVIITANHIVDVVSEYTPTVEFYHSTPAQKQ